MNVIPTLLYRFSISPDLLQQNIFSMNDDANNGEYHKHDIKNQVLVPGHVFQYAAAGTGNEVAELRNGDDVPGKQSHKRKG